MMNLNNTLKRVEDFCGWSLCLLCFGIGLVSLVGTVISTPNPWTILIQLKFTILFSCLGIIVCPKIQLPTLAKVFLAGVAVYFLSF